MLEREGEAEGPRSMTECDGDGRNSYRRGEIGDGQLGGQGNGIAEGGDWSCLLCRINIDIAPVHNMSVVVRRTATTIR